MSDVKEPQYFADELALNPPPTNLPTTIEHYLSLFASATPSQMIGESSTLYLWSHTAARNIASVRPDSRIIIIMREPADFLLSFHLQLVKVRIETVTDPGLALALENERRDGRRLPRSGYWSELLLYSEHMKYMDQIGRYHAVFPADQILVLVYDDFRADHQTFLHTILKFLGVTDSVTLPMTQSNPSLRVRARQIEYGMEALSEGHGRLSSVVKTAFCAVTTQRMRRAAQHAIRSHIVYRPPRKPDNDLISDLRCAYRSEVEALSEYLKRDLITLWDYDSAA